jgi:hypothetical protein
MSLRERGKSFKGHVNINILVDTDFPEDYGTALMNPTSPSPVFCPSER